MSAGLHRHIVRGVGWAFASSWAQLTVSLVAFAVIARLIGPIGFGHSTMAGALVALCQVVVGPAAGEVLVQRQSPDRAVESAWALLAVGLGGAITALLLLSRGLIAAWYGEPIVAQLLLGYAWLPLLLAIQCVPEACLAREMRFHVQALAGGSGAILGGVAGIYAAWRGAGAWSMVVLQLVQVGVTCGVILLGAGWRPSRRLDLMPIPDMLRYARSSLGVRLLLEFDSQFPKLIVGAMLGPTALGLLAVSIRILDILKNLLIVPLNTVALPSVAKARAQGADLQQLFGAALRLSTGIASPAFLGLIAIAPLLLGAMLGSEWLPAAPVLQLLALIGIRSSVSSFNGAALRGCGRPDLQLRLGWMGAALTAVLVPLAAPWGILAAAGAMVLRGYATWPIAAWLVERLGVFPARRQFMVGSASLLLAGAMAVIVVLIRDALDGPWGALPTLGLCVLAGAVVYAIGLKLFLPDEITALMSMLQRARAPTRS